MPAEMVGPLLDDEKWPSVAQACQQVPTGVEQKLPWLTPAVQISQDGTRSATRARVAPLGAISIFQVECGSSGWYRNHPPTPRLGDKAPRASKIAWVGNGRGVLPTDPGFIPCAVSRAARGPKPWVGGGSSTATGTGVNCVSADADSSLDSGSFSRGKRKLKIRAPEDSIPHKASKSFFSQIKLFCRDSPPKVDVFGSADCGNLPIWWNATSAGLKSPWGGLNIYLHPPVEWLSATVDKIFLDEAYGAILVPELGSNEPWFRALEKVAIRWWEVPEDLPLFVNGHGQALATRPDWTFRVVQFDAQGAQKEWLEALNLQPSHQNLSEGSTGLTGPQPPTPHTQKGLDGTETYRAWRKQRLLRKYDLPESHSHSSTPTGPQSRPRAPGPTPARGPKPGSLPVYSLGACALAAKELASAAPQGPSASAKEYNRRDFGWHPPFALEPGQDPLGYFPKSWKFQKPIRAVIESYAFEGEEVEKFREAIREDFRDVLYEKTYAKDIDPKIRGEFGIAHIRLKPDTQPRKDPPIRQKGDREVAFQKLIEKLMANGWIEPSCSPWGSRGFVVPKPGKSDEFRLVVDYRYLNLHTIDDAHPIPHIEDLISDEAQNAIWTIFDLEDGFHQMHLDEASRPLTAFVTPWGQFQFNVLPMGCKNAPAMFQRMVH